MSSLLYCSWLRTLVLSVLFLLLACASTSIASAQAQADLSVSKSGPATAAPNTAVSYQVVVTNTGPDAADNATVVDNLPPDLFFASVSAPAGWSCAAPPVGSTGQIRCVNASLPVVDNVAFTVVANTNPSAVTGSFITNKAVVSTTATDPNDENNESSATLRVGNADSTNLGVMLSADAETVSAGANVTYTITLTNSSTASNVKVTDKIPAGMTFVSVAAPSGWTCSHPSVGSGGTVDCTIPMLAATDGVSFTSVLKIPANASDGDVFTNFASVTSDTYDSNAEDDVSAIGVTVVGTYAISLTSGNGQTTAINNSFPSPLQVAVTVNGSPKSGATVTFQAPSNGPSLTFGASDSNVEITTTDSNGVAVSSTLTANSIAGGPYNITITSGNAPAVTASVTNSKGSQLISFPAIGPHTYGEQPFSLMATASSGLPATFSVVSGPATVSGSALTLIGAGSVTVQASQTGDNNYNPAPPVQQTFTSLKQTPSTAVTSSINPADLGELITFTAVVSGTTNSIAPSGTVQFKDGTVSLNAPVNCIAANNTCVAQASVSSLSPGSHVIAAAYSGDSNYQPATGNLTNGQVVNPLPSLSINDVSKSEGNSGTTSFDFAVTLSATSHLTVQVAYTTADGTATVANHDYRSATGSITFKPGDQTKTVSVLVNGDINREPDETFFVDLAGPSNATIAKSRGTATILNDDTLDPPSLLLEETQARPNQAAAVDSLLFLRDPFSVQSAATWWDFPTPDRNTRVIVFASNLTLDQGESSQAVIVGMVDGNGAGFDVPAEDVRPIPGVPTIAQITFRLPDNLASGPCGLTIKYHGLFSNQAVIRIR